MSIEQDTVDATYAAWGKAANYKAPDNSITPCSVIFDRSDRDVNMAGFKSQIIAEGRLVEVRKTEIAAPTDGGIFTVGSEEFKIIGDPKSLDPDRLVWTCTVQ